MTPLDGLCLIFKIFLTGNCNGNLAFRGDGYCDDDLNNLLCGYDGGDCCGANVNTIYCSECLCKEGSSTSSPLATTWPTGSTTQGTVVPNKCYTFSK